MIRRAEQQLAVGNQAIPERLQFCGASRCFYVPGTRRIATPKFFGTARFLEMSLVSAHWKGSSLHDRLLPSTLDIVFAG